MIKCNLILIIQPNDFQFDIRTRGYHFEQDGKLSRLTSIVITLLATTTDFTLNSYYNLF